MLHIGRCAAAGSAGTAPRGRNCCRPGDMPKRSTGPKGRIALVHALAHIELNAVDLAWDIIARFTER